MFRNAGIGVDLPAVAWNDGGDPIQRQADIGLAGQFLNYWSVSLFALRSEQVVDDRNVTRGGPLSLVPAGWTGGATLTADPRQAVNGALNVNYARDAARTWNLTVNPVINLRPSAAVLLSVGPTYTVGWTAAQHVTTHADPTATATYGARYIVGELDQRQLNTTVRLNLTFTPILSLQLYAQPFVFSGGYTTFKELKTPRTFSFNVYGRDNGSSISYDPASTIYTVHPAASVPASDTIQFYNPDARIRSWRSNAVLRWEYRPGSTLFLVWSESRYIALLDPTLDLGHYLAQDLFRDPPTNVLVIKVNYWMSL